MLQSFAERCGEVLAQGLARDCTPDGAMKLAALVGYNTSPLFGAEKKKVRLMGEWVIANSAMVICTVNEVFGRADAKQVIDHFLAVTRDRVFRFIEGKDATFEDRYETRTKEYFQAFGRSCVQGQSSGEAVAPGLMWAAAFGQSSGEAVAPVLMWALDADPTVNEKALQKLSLECGAIMLATLVLLRKLKSEADAEAQKRAAPTSRGYLGMNILHRGTTIWDSKEGEIGREEISHRVRQAEGGVGADPELSVDLYACVISWVVAMGDFEMQVFTAQRGWKRSGDYRIEDKEEYERQRAGCAQAAALLGSLLTPGLTSVEQLRGIAAAALRASGVEATAKRWALAVVDGTERQHWTGNHPRVRSQQGR